MADNFETNPGSGGKVFASDEIAGTGVHVPRVKVQFGGDGQATDVSDSSPLPVHDPEAATQAGLDAIVLVLGQLATAAAQAAAKTTLDAILAKLISSPATAQGQADQLQALTVLLSQTDGIEGSLVSILAKLTADPATASAQAAELLKLSSIDTKLPALAGGKLPVTDPTALPLPSGAATASAQATGNTSLASIDGKLPALASGKLPVTDPTALPLPTGAATAAAQTTGNTSLASIDGKLGAPVAGRAVVDNLGQPGVARQLAAGSASANTAITAGVRRVSMYASGADIRYAIGAAAQTASATTHLIAQGERLDVSVPASAYIAVMRAGAIDGVLELTELS